MDDMQFVELSSWIAEAGLAGWAETVTLKGFCERALALGLPIARAVVLIDTLHPIYEGRAFPWNPDEGEPILSEYGHTSAVRSRWERSPFHRLELRGESSLRRNLNSNTEPEFSI